MIGENSDIISAVIKREIEVETRGERRGADRFIRKRLCPDDKKIAIKIFAIRRSINDSFLRFIGRSCRPCRKCAAVLKQPTCLLPSPSLVLWRRLFPPAGNLCRRKKSVQACKETRSRVIFGEPNRAHAQGDAEGGARARGQGMVVAPSKSDLERVIG